MSMINLANSLTILRLIAVPILVVLHYSYSWLCLWVFILASMTDWLDGFIARKKNQVSPLGTFLDPIADKLLVITVLLLLMKRYEMTIAVLLVVSREIVVSGLREWGAKSNKKVPVSMKGKLKTMLQMIALTILLYEPSDYRVEVLGHSLLWGSIILAWCSMCDYAKGVAYCPKNKEK